MLVIDKEYDSYLDFYYENSDLIYKTIISLYEEMEQKQVENMDLIMEVKAIDDMEYKTSITFKRNDKDYLMGTLLPHFESIEDYLTCEKIKNLI